mmetsp:Transcript_16178/g.26558  ORF Transcript_16178/g.26558 Transcript_16178/m.26558 type:complete len:658 (+) Transcript_16178:110-2083(+)
MLRFALLLLSMTALAYARPIVRHIRSTHEFDRLMKKHSTQTGLPVIVDFYSDGCGPCRMIAPIFKKLAQEVEGKAVFVKVDTNALHELSSRYGVRSLPTFKFFLGGRKVQEFSGAGEQQLRQFTQDIIQKAEWENVILPLDNLVSYYGQQDASKTDKDIQKVYKKCVDQVKDNNPEKLCVGAVARNLAKSLKKKYGSGPEFEKRFLPEEPSTNEQSSDKQAGEGSGGSKKTNKGNSDKPNLHLATKEELLAELESRLDAERDAQVEEEEDDNAEFEHGWEPSEWPERVTIIGGGPAGLSAAIYAARAGLKPVVVAPPMGQLQGKGVDVENYPGLFNVTGPAVVSLMRQQAIAYGASFEADVVVGIDASVRPMKVKTNSSLIETHSIIVATGAESNWLNVKGEYEMRGGGVSSCATCDGHIYRGKHVLVVGGGDTAMEDALVLARTSESVTVIHRRDTFRASNVLAQRVSEHPSISIKWNTVIAEILGKPLSSPTSDGENVDLDAPVEKVVSGAVLKDVYTGEETTVDVDAVFVAIGHTPTTSFLEGVVEFNPEHAGYVLTQGTSTKTSVPGIFACGDVADSIYRQAITSAGSGAAAALDAERWLSEEGLGNEESEFEAELLADIMANDGRRSGEEYNVYEEAGGRVSGMKESTGSEL